MYSKERCGSFRSPLNMLFLLWVPVMKTGRVWSSESERHRCLSRHTWTHPHPSWATLQADQKPQAQLKASLASMRLNWRSHLTFLTETRHTQGSRTPVLGLALILHTKENLFLQQTAFWWTSSLWAREQRSRAVISDTERWWYVDVGCDIDSLLMCSSCGSVCDGWSFRGRLQLEKIQTFKGKEPGSIKPLIPQLNPREFIQ